jgi:hypothetical protein
VRAGAWTRRSTSPADPSPSAVRRVDPCHQLNRLVTRPIKPPIAGRGSSAPELSRFLTLDRLRRRLARNRLGGYAGKGTITGRAGRASILGRQAALDCPLVGLTGNRRGRDVGKGALTGRQRVLVRICGRSTGTGSPGTEAAGTTASLTMSTPACRTRSATWNGITIGPRRMPAAAANPPPLSAPGIRCGHGHASC